MTARWTDFQREAPALARFVRQRLEDHGLALLATLTAGGAPRISGIEPIINDDGLWLAMMPNSVKGADLRRDGRFALHNATVDKDVTQGDVKIQGVAIRVARRPSAGAPDVGEHAELFETTLTRVASIRVVDDHLQIDTWEPGRPAKSQDRY